MIIQDQNLSRCILYALSDRHMSKILESTSVVDRTTIEIIQEHNISHTTAYDKIHQLLKFGLLVRCKSEINEGKKIFYYRSTFRSFDIRYNGLSAYRIDAIPNRRS